jgi:hypothetical protein
MNNVTRSESDILTKAPIKVTLGSKEYDIPVLTIKKQREWREQMSREMQDIVGALAPSFDPQKTSSAFSAGLAVALTKFPEKLADLVFSYAPELPREEIMETATEEQISIAFSKIMRVSFPFLAHLQTVRSVIQASA